MPEGIDKKGSVRGPCAGSGARTGGRPMTAVIRTFRPGRALRRVFDDRYGPKGRKREESGAKRPGEPLFWLLTGGTPCPRQGMPENRGAPGTPNLHLQQNLFKNRIVFQAKHTKDI